MLVVLRLEINSVLILTQVLSYYFFKWLKEGLIEIDCNEMADGIKQKFHS